MRPVSRISRSSASGSIAMAAARIFCSSSSTSDRRSGHAPVRMQRMQRTTSARPCSSSRNPTIGMRNLNGQMIGPVGLNMLRSFCRKDWCAKDQPEIMKAKIAGKKNSA